MRIRSKIAIVGGLAAAALSAGGGVLAGAQQAPNSNRVVNGEPSTASTVGWDSNGFGVVAFGSSPTVPPATAFTPPFVFQAPFAGATMTQEVSFADLASSIDAGQQPIYALAALGAAGSGNDGAELVVQPQNAQGDPLGSPIQLGPPTAQDREDQAKLVACTTQFTAPVGMRSALVTLEATGTPGTPSTAMGDEILLADSLSFADDAPVEPAQGPNCLIPVPGYSPPTASGPTGGPPPSSSTVTTTTSTTTHRTSSSPAPHLPATKPRKHSTRASRARLRARAKAIAACQKLPRHKRSKCVKAAERRYA